MSNCGTFILKEAEFCKVAWEAKRSFAQRGRQAGNTFVRSAAFASRSSAVRRSERGGHRDFALQFTTQGFDCFLLGRVNSCVLVVFNSIVQ